MEKYLFVVVVHCQQDKNSKEAREGIERKSGKVNRVRYKMKIEHNRIDLELSLNVVCSIIYSLV